MAFNAPKGTHDIYGDDARGYDYIEQVLKGVADTYGFDEMRTPIFEQTDLYQRSVGESSDVVRKEMYTFNDKGGRSMTLRPELTAGIMRSIVSNKLYATMQDLPIKTWYLGPIFRYERPQAGRYRQFSQFGIESVGVTSFYSDVEVIMLGYDALKMLGFENIELRINTLGDKESRNRYREALRQYFAHDIDHMCEDCKQRYEINPLRILDCKVPEDQEIAKKAPKLRDFLSEEAEDYFEKILSLLDDYEIPYVIDDNLVRGLDYYSHVVFEFHYTSKTGKNLGAVGAGGHYGDLLHEIGGPQMEGVGLAFGVERIYQLMTEDGLLENQCDHYDISVMALDASALPLCFDLTTALRANGYRVDMMMEAKGIKPQFKRAERKHAQVALIVGQNELDQKHVILRDFIKQEQYSVSLEDVMESLHPFFEEQEEEHEHTCHCHDGGCCCHEEEEK